MMTLTSLSRLKLRVLQSGHVHRVYDFRCEWRGNELVCTQLVVGRRGLLERLGFRRGNHDLVPCKGALEIRDTEIVLRDGPG